ncbi:site-specific integrase [Ruminococcus sp. AM22-14LB]|jgi:site-specific recombinase XerD|nr:site-specific integrase [Ruminococcus sp. AM22-14LB]
MNERVEYSQLDCYKRATDEQKRKLNQEQYFDLGKLPEETLRKEFEKYIRHRGTKVSILTIKVERNYFNSLCEFLQKPSNQVKSLMERDENVWIKQLKAWMLQNGRALTKAKKRVYQNESVEKVALIRYFENVIQFTVDLSETNELTKDIWYLERLPIIIRSNPIVNHKTINFRKIEQPDIRQEMKKAIYYHLQYEAIATVTREVSVMNKFSKYLKEKYPQVDSCEEIDRNIIEKFLIYLKIEVESGNGKRDDLIKLRDVLETVGKIYGWEQLGRLFIKSDFPPERRGEFKYYSDSELKRLNAHIVKLEEQIARALIIHQLLGNRISDTLTMRKDCLYKKDNQDMVIIHQPKSRRFEKPVSAEVAQLIKKAIVYAEQNYKESIYIFANKDNPQKPLNYQTLREKVIRMIYENDLRDDQGELFGFGSHLFRHTYGVKLTELHVDDWTISKLIGHKNVKSVKYYRKMSNQSMADETREARNYMSNVILANLDGWGEEYEQIR